MKRCVVSMALGERYQPMMGRLISSFHQVGDPVDVIAWVPLLAAGATPGELPNAAYCAKPFALQAAADLGYEVVLWIDVACYAIRHTMPLFGFIGHNEYFIQDNGWKMGQWCSDAALQTLQVTRNDAMAIPELASTVIGLDLRKEKPRRFLSEWCRLAADGITFPGPHANSLVLSEIERRGLPRRTAGFVSHDLRVLGHRHDQTAATAIAHKLEWVGTQRPEFVDYWSESPDPRTLLLDRGGF